MIPSRFGLLMGSFVLWNGLLAAPHAQISAKPPGSLAQHNALSKETRFIANERAEPEKKSVSIDVVVRPMSSSGQTGNGGSGEKQRTGEMAGVQVESAGTVDPTPAENIPASPLLGEKPTKIPEYEEEEDEDDDEDDDEAEEHEAEEADDDYDAAEDAEEADDDDNDDDGGGGGDDGERL
ncbi:CREB3 regulatory factor-like [Anolis sagrei]|uniref:CREB3 regulatory factor-like n=1 Tax=Anolis sagrei TaxID=38937 RepID=UPI003521DD00